MKKHVVLQFALMSSGPFSQRYPESPNLYVDVTNQFTRESIAMWPLNTLRFALVSLFFTLLCRERIFEMREYYEHHTSNDHLRDPFADRPPWFSSVGRAYVTLQSLLHGLALEHEVGGACDLNCIFIPAYF
jgi:hypothetical protein